ncbi:MAG: polysaccharide biosynthesis/export family protein [Verrucomicrobiota bacterium]|nr:polysaccharide biosynthesis/export family protein [Verrucomicrobiota bacterium]
MAFFRVAVISLFVLLLSSCSETYMGKEIYGSDEFVRDSYRIAEGKFAILEMQGVCYDELDPALLDEYQDVIGEDDILQIAVFHPKREDITRAVQSIGAAVGFKVADGKIRLPDLFPIHVAGLTLEQARQKIQEEYNGQILDTEVFIGYRERIVRKVELAGLVGLSSIPVDGKMRLFDVLSKAKIPPEANLFKSYILRDGKALSVDLVKLIKHGDMSQNIVMRGGDKIYIAETNAASLMVMGEVGCERVISLPIGCTTLRQALAESGGIPFTGDRSYIQVIRGSISKPKIYTLNWELVIHLPNQSLLLMPGDIVYVAAKPITNWNRFISQIPPFLGGIEAVRGGCANWGLFAP